MAPLRHSARANAKILQGDIFTTHIPPTPYHHLKMCSHSKTTECTHTQNETKYTQQTGGFVCQELGESHVKGDYKINI